MNEREAYINIRTFELEVGECFFDQNESFVKKYNLLFWLLGKGYLSNEQFNWWIMNPSQYMGINSVFKTYNNKYSVFEGIEVEELTDNKQIQIISELIDSVDILQLRLNLILEEYGISETYTHEDVNDIIKEYEKVKNMSIQEVIKEV